eukprot:INCI638.1.p1 GENE.INCI638.1~~INCI638.1.p1  ORF type:complete len:441 (-),score=100.69 INCI638.1:728-2050(-)
MSSSKTENGSNASGRSRRATLLACAAAAVGIGLLAVHRRNTQEKSKAATKQAVKEAVQKAKSGGGANMALANAAVLVESEDMPEGSQICSGYDFNAGVNYDALFGSLATHGFQATNLGLAINEVNRMLKWRLSDREWKEADADYLKDPDVRANTRCTIFLGFTSNMISCGNREVLRYLFQHKLVDCAVTTGGGIEEDIMKCFNPHYMGDFALKGRELRKKGLNRIGNLIVPNKNYCSFEDWISPILTAMKKEQAAGTIWTPSKFIHRLGKEINNENSVYYWAYKNDIPIFCPAITDGSIGDMIYFHDANEPLDDDEECKLPMRERRLIIDIAGDIRRLNDIAQFAQQTGMIILGGGVVKHHICNANLMRNGADFSVFINTGQEFDGSDSGARPDEAISWGKIKVEAKPVKVYGDASLLFPLLVSQTFASQSNASERLARQ